MISDEAVEAAAWEMFGQAYPYTWARDLDEVDTPLRERFMARATAALEAALPHIQAQTLDEAVDAFPLETIRAPDNAVVWMHRRAQDIRKGGEVMASLGKIVVEVLTVEAELPYATFDGGVWHCDGRLVTRETAKTAYEEALFWLAIHKAEQRMK